MLVIGGGATGLGTAVEAASRGYRTLLVERFDFAKGTSSRSTKLVHGGVRYLEQLNLTLVTDALRSAATCCEMHLILSTISSLSSPLTVLLRFPTMVWPEGL